MTTTEEKPKMIGTPEARDLIEQSGLGPISLPTVIEWCKQYHLGVKIGGRWYINEDRLRQFLNKGRENEKKA
jgi:hypothetical protein